MNEWMKHTYTYTREHTLSATELTAPGKETAARTIMVMFLADNFTILQNAF